MRTDLLSTALRRSALLAALLAAAPRAFASNTLEASEIGIQRAFESASVPADESARHVRIEGSVVLPDGRPAKGAVVVSSAGGQAVVQHDGSFTLDVAVDPTALALELTAVANGSRGALIAHQRVDGLGDGFSGPITGPISRNGGILVLADSPSCVPEWIPTFGGTPGFNDAVHALAVFDDGSGSGPALFVGGSFSSVGGHGASCIAKWDGQSWSALGSGLNLPVLALAVFDDGSGEALYAGGSFTFAGGVSASRIAKWDGKTWSALGSGAANSVYAFAVFDDGLGAGPALYAAGAFTAAGGAGANRVARWDGQAWNALGTGVNNAVLSLKVFDDGSGAGPALYAGGFFTTAGDQPANRVAKWDGQAWSALGDGMNDTVYALAVFDDGAGGGPALYAGGAFTSAGGQTANNVAKWDGQSWSALAGGTNSWVRALTVFDDGSGGGSALYAVGEFTGADGLNARRIAKWDGLGWSVLGTGLNDTANAVIGMDTGAGAVVYVGGEFTTAGGGSANRIAQWSAQAWGPLDGTSQTLDGAVHALAVFDDSFGGGPKLYAAGDFKKAGSLGVGNIARWDGQGWSPLAGGVNGVIRTLAVFDDGAGSLLYAGGDFTIAGGLPANRMAKWNGVLWRPVGSGMDAPVHALMVFDDAGPAPAFLCAGGEFTAAGGVSANRVAGWNGVAWSALGTGFNNTVEALAVYDDPSAAGPQLYAAGSFTFAGPLSANRVAKWNGEGWTGLGTGLSGPAYALTTFDDGAGMALYAGGQFNTAGGAIANRIAKWRGVSWSAVGTGMNETVHALVVHDDGSTGQALYAGGQFSAAGGVSANRIAKWDGQTWSPLGAGMVGTVLELLDFNDFSGTGNALYAAGSFDASASGDSYIAKWDCSAVDSLPGCYGNPAVLTALVDKPSLGTIFEVALSSSQLPSGLGLLYSGNDGTDLSGCGVLVPGLGELMLVLAPPPVNIAVGSLSGGIVAFGLPVPSLPGAVGIRLAMQGVVVDFSIPGSPIEFSNALLLTVTE